MSAKSIAENPVYILRPFLFPVFPVHQPIIKHDESINMKVTFVPRNNKGTPKLISRTPLDKGISI